MIRVLIKKQSNYPISNVSIRKTLQDFFKNQGVVSDAVVNVSVVGEKTMRELAQKFLGERNVVHNVLSFTESEAKAKFVYPDERWLQLGEIVICYPKIFAEAKDEGVMIEKKALELIKHSAWHLMGVHHE